MGAHLIDGEFQSDKYPTTPRGKVPLSVKDESAQDLLWEYAQRRRAKDAEFADDLEKALLSAGYLPAISPSLARVAEVKATIKGLKLAAEHVDAEIELVAENESDVIVGRCDSCNAVLFVGDKGFVFVDGPSFCEEHSPTWADAHENHSAADEDDEDRMDFFVRYEAHIAAGGSDKDSLAYVL